MSMSRSPEQRARFVRSAATDLDAAPELAARLLFLSETARSHADTGARPPDRTVRLLLGFLLDDELCRHAWWVADEGEALWSLLLRVARPPRDVGPATVLAMALARRNAADEALDVLLDAVRDRVFRRPAIELLAELSEDCGRPDLAWTQVTRLGLAHPDLEWGTLRCVLGCSDRRQCERSRLGGSAHARWLRQRVSRWARRLWSGGQRSPAYRLVQPYAQASPQWGTVLRGYLDARGGSLPLGERRLLESWTRVRRREFVVLDTSRWEAVLAADGGRWTAGWESASPLQPGTRVSGWLLPTLHPRQWLMARTTDAPTW
jgi:hypothetical protein